MHNPGTQKWKYTFLLSFWVVLMGIITAFSITLTGTYETNNILFPMRNLYLGIVLIIIGIIGIQISICEYMSTRTSLPQSTSASPDSEQSSKPKQEDRYN